MILPYPSRITCRLNSACNSIALHSSPRSYANRNFAAHVLGSIDSGNAKRQSVGSRGRTGYASFVQQARSRAPPFSSPSAASSSRFQESCYPCVARSCLCRCCSSLTLRVVIPAYIRRRARARACETLYSCVFVSP